MKNTGFILLALTTFILVLLAVFSALDFPFAVIYYMMCAGQILLIFSVYKVLTDKYTTTKTFEDFYEDHPVKDR